MIVIWLPGAFLAVFGWIGAMIGLVAGGVEKRRLADSSASRRYTDLYFGFAIVVLPFPLVAYRLAIISTGWTDTDGDGMLDGFVAGQYDFFDVVLPSISLWAIGLGASGLAAFLLLKRRLEITVNSADTSIGSS